MIDGNSQKSSDRYPTSDIRPLISDRLVIATHNPGKLAEMRELLAPYGKAAISAGELGLAEPDETGMTFADNARIKAEAAAKAAKLPALADDSGLIVAGPARIAIFIALWKQSNNNCAPVARWRRTAAVRISSRRYVWPGLMAMSRNSRRASPGRWYGRRAAIAASVMIRFSCRMASSALSARCRARKNTDCRRAARVCHIAPARS